MPSGFTLAVLRDDKMTCACVTMRTRVHISVCGTQDRQDKTRQGVKTTKTGGVAPHISALGMPIQAVWATVRPFFDFDAGPVGGATRRPKTTQTGGGGGAAGCCSARTVSCAPPIGYEASWTPTAVPWVPSKAVFGCFWPVWPVLDPPHLRGPLRGVKWLLLVVVVVVACSYYGERGGVITL